MTALDVALEEIAGCFEGEIPAAIATMSPEGVPNVTYLSIVHRVDAEHVALSRQFFNKTDANTAADPRATVQLIDPDSGRQFRLRLVYERTETSGPLFERMRTNLDAVAAQEGMTGVFRLRGVDVCRVMACTAVPVDDWAELPQRRGPDLERLEAFATRIAAPTDLDSLLRTTLDAGAELLGFEHAFIMLADERRERLFTVASIGFPFTGTGSEVRVGDGVIGLAAERRQPVRIANVRSDLAYSRAIRRRLSRAEDRAVAREIPVPGIADCQSQLATPLLAYGELLGVLCLQSPTPGRFRAADEQMMSIIASQLGMAMAMVVRDDPAPASGAPAADAAQIRYYHEDDSVFIDNEYLIKGVAGRMLWLLLRTYLAEQREDFSNRELRLDPALDLPDIKDNLEARLTLLRKRLEERCAFIRIVRTGRGRFRLEVDRPLALTAVEDPGATRLGAPSGPAAPPGADGTRKPA